MKNIEDLLKKERENLIWRKESLTKENYDLSLTAKAKEEEIEQLKQKLVDIDNLIEYSKETKKTPILLNTFLDGTMDTLTVLAISGVISLGFQNPIGFVVPFVVLEPLVIYCAHKCYKEEKKKVTKTSQIEYLKTEQQKLRELIAKYDSKEINLIRDKIYENNLKINTLNQILASYNQEIPVYEQSLDLEVNNTYKKIKRKEDN